MHTPDPQFERRAALVKVLRSGRVRTQDDLVQLLKKAGHKVTQSSISRDLRELGVLKAGDGYLVPNDSGQVNNDFDRLADFVRDIRMAGPSLTVIKTTIGAAQSIAVALDRAEWPEIVGTISGDDTIFIATQDARQQRKVIERLRTHFKL